MSAAVTGHTAHGIVTPGNVSPRHPEAVTCRLEAVQGHPSVSPSLTVPSGAAPVGVDDTPTETLAQHGMVRKMGAMERKQQQTLRDLLTERHIRMDAAATLAGVSTSTISRICSGAETARPATVVALAQALKVSARRMQALCDASHEAGRATK